MEHKKILIDTSIVIEHLRKQNKQESNLYRFIQKHDLFISVVTEFELYSGAVNSEKEKDILNILAAIKTLPFSSESAYEASKIYKFLKQHNQIIEIGDIFIGATGLTYNMPLLTNNIKHFKRIEGLLLLKP